MVIFRADRKFERVEDVTQKILKNEKVKLLLCDLDNTIRLHSEKEPTDELTKWVKECHAAGIRIVVVSNNGRKKMMQKFCEPLKIDCIWWAGKPMSKKLTETMRKYHFNPDETVMLGDKWYTDVLAARFAKIRAWKVKHRVRVV